MNYIFINPNLKAILAETQLLCLFIFQHIYREFGQTTSMNEPCPEQHKYCTLSVADKHMSVMCKMCFQLKTGFLPCNSA